MSKLGNYTYRVVSGRRELTAAQASDITSLSVASVRQDYPDRRPEELEALAREAELTRLNPNKGVGGNLLRRHQAYARPVGVLAINDGELQAYLPVADNASSQKPFPLGSLERQAKLRLTEVGDEDFIGHRYMWLGHAALSERLREDMQGQGPKIVNPVDVMMTLAARNKDERQPVSAYPWAYEGLWKAQLHSAGLSPAAGDSELLYAFGDDATPVVQERWTGNVAALRESILRKAGAGAAITVAVSELGSGVQ